MNFGANSSVGPRLPSASSPTSNWVRTDHCCVSVEPWTEISPLKFPMQIKVRSLSRPLEGTSVNRSIGACAPSAPGGIVGNGMKKFEPTKISTLGVSKSLSKAPEGCLGGYSLFLRGARWGSYRQVSREGRVSKPLTGIVSRCLDVASMGSVSPRGRLPMQRLAFSRSRRYGRDFPRRVFLRNAF